MLSLQTDCTARKPWRSKRKQSCRFRDASAPSEREALCALVLSTRSAPCTLSIHSPTPLAREKEELHHEAVPSSCSTLALLSLSCALLSPLTGYPRAQQSTNRTHVARSCVVRSSSHPREVARPLCAPPPPHHDSAALLLSPSRTPYPASRLPFPIEPWSAHLQHPDPGRRTLRGEKGPWSATETQGARGPPDSGSGARAGA